MSDKYIIKNCPAIYGIDDGFLCSYREDGESEKYCYDCTDCLLKQIVELCKEDLKPAREWQEGDTVFIEYKKDVHLANNILQLLDIQEVK